MDDDGSSNNVHKTTESQSSPPPLTELIQSLEQATLMAKQLPSTTEPTYLLHIYSFLHHAHQNLSTFLSNTPFPAPDNALSSATRAAADDNGVDPMQVGDDYDDGDDEEENSKASVDKVEEKMRDCFIKNKRPKRPLSPSSMAVVEEKRLYEDGFVGCVNGFDPHETKLRAFDLVYQFHG